MEIVINEKRRKSKVIGIRLYKEGYMILFPQLRKNKKVSWSPVAESLTDVVTMGRLT